MRFIAESALLTIFLLILVPVAVGLTCGFLSAWAARHKHRNRKIWFLIGFFFPVAGLVTALLIPSAVEPHALRISRLRRTMEADIKGAGKGFQQRAAGLTARVKEMEDAAKHLHRRLMEVEKQLSGTDPYHAARRRRRLMRRLGWTPGGSRADAIKAEMGVLDEELITHRQLKEKAETLSVRLMKTAAVTEKLSHRIRRLSFGAEDSAASEEELQEIIQEAEVEVEALEELHRETS